MRQLAALALIALWLTPARAAEQHSPATLVIDAGSGRVLLEDRAGQPRHPASLTKLMTVYVAFTELAAGRVSPDTRLTVSDAAAAQGGSVLGLKAGQTLTLAEALRAVVVRSANDAAVAVAEHLAGSEPAFATRMTREAARLGMNATRFANATGLTAAGHLTTARDMALLALALKRDFPDRWSLFSAREVEWRKNRLPTLNGFLTAYQGAEGMKTGFTCPAGYNLTAAASRGGRQAIAVVMGAASKEQRLALAARLMDRAFNGATEGTALVQLANLPGPAPDLSSDSCRGGVPGDSFALPKAPAGWAIEVAFGRDRATVARELAREAKALRAELAGGTPIVTVRPFDGGLRYRGLITGLKEEKAVPACLRLRQHGEERCLTLSPTAVEGAIDTERRWRMYAAR
ncbi:D-alanyl-D-alanine carboxypeptidase family protein [Magnetospirillum moscoviense]|uniref:D-alanyl-D-alanine carboxypeptidase n=1 Tax=Magnetospirillum moscoviense TaxID=1437059 RepID=A0A178MYB4_9PROT|nr:D-alanyl-D-alanine carboxypeptidase family protein [Magnetospirillum moscoviense]MBF0326352.1 D-alanyl-D-alanine carboxypeptidase [Alphaproteobacteria bacterium]OAN60913.1 D-alanyl-D-alanine carboxypeptidase [Magnetospirillum moscoviense]